MIKVFIGLLLQRFDAFKCIIPGRIDKIAYRVQFHEFGWIRFEKIFQAFYFGYARIEPQVIVPGIEYYRHAVVYRLQEGIRCGSKDSA